jgi:hypothetical protein
MNFKITNDDDNEFETIKVEVTFHVDSWYELQRIMEKLDNEFGE